MRRHLARFAVALIAVLAAAVMFQILNRKLQVNLTAVPPVDLYDSKCIEPKTTNDFAQFWNRFRGAVGDQDKSKLFSMLRTCSFDWFVLNDNEQFRKPLAPTFTPVSFPPPFQSQTLIRTSRSGTSFVFQDADDFLANYAVIFSNRITRHILTDTPIETTDGRYEIRWRDDGLRTLRFERIPEVGYKFGGLQWNP